MAFHQADNDMSLRRACLRRSRPDRKAYTPGEWVMMWQPDKVNGYWFGPLKVVNQEGQFSIWATQSGKLYRRAPEHVRPLCSSEARMVPSVTPDDPHSHQQPPTSTIPATEEDHTNISNNPSLNPSLNNHNTNRPDPEIDHNSQSEDQPDTEPGAATPSGSVAAPVNPNTAIETPIPDQNDDDELTTTHLLCCEDEVYQVDPLDTPCAWRCELELPNNLVTEEIKDWTPDDILLATSEKKQRTEVKMTMLNAEERSL